MSSKYKVIAFVFLFVGMLFVLHFILTIYRRARKKEAYRNVESFSDPSNTSSLDPRIQIIDAVDLEAITESEKTTLLQKAFKRFENLKDATPQGIKDFVKSCVSNRSENTVSDPSTIPIHTLPTVSTISGVRDSASHSADMTAVMSKVSTLTEQSAALMKTVNEMKAIALSTNAHPPIMLPHHHVMRDHVAFSDPIRPAGPVSPVGSVSPDENPGIPVSLDIPVIPVNTVGDGRAAVAFQTLTPVTQSFATVHPKVEQVEAFENMGHRGTYAMYTDET